MKESGATRELYTPEPTQIRVIERHLDGASNRKIAREEGLDRETVNRILSQSELVEMRAELQSRLERMASKALDVYEETLGSTDAHLAAAIATKILEGTGVMDKRGLQGTIDDAKARHHRATDEIWDPLASDEFPWPPEPTSSEIILPFGPILESTSPEPKKRARKETAQGSD